MLDAVATMLALRPFDRLRDHKLSDRIVLTPAYNQG